MLVSNLKSTGCAGSAAQQLNWYAARTRYGQELLVKGRLEIAGVEHFIPTRPAFTKGKGGADSKGLCNCNEKRTREKPLMTNLVFLRATKERACALANEEGLPVHYIIDCTTHSMLVVPDKQMEDFIRVVDADDAFCGLWSNTEYALGDRVRVTRGLLKDVEGNVEEICGRIYLVVRLIDTLIARVKIPRGWVEKIECHA